MAVSDITYFSTLLGISPVLVIAFLLWAVIWKGLALWKSARKSSKIWFIILLVVNTLGILEILYIFVFSELGKKQPGKQEKRKKKR